MRTFLSRYFQGMALAWLALLVSLSAVAVGFWNVRQSALWRDRRRFEDEVLATGDELKVRLTRYQELDGMLRREIEACDELNDTEWKRIAGTIDWLRLYPLLMGIGYAESVGEHAPVRFVESRLAGLESPDGWDLNNEPGWRDALLKARTTGMSSAAIGPDLLPSKKNTTIVIFGPVFRRNFAASPSTGPVLRGFVLVSLDPAALLRDEPHAVANGMLRMEPIEVPSDDEVLHPEPFRRTVTMTALSHTWTVRYTPGNAFVRDSHAPLPWWVLGGGTAVSLLLFGIVWTQMRLRMKERMHNLELEERIDERTEELQAANLRLEEAYSQEHELNALKSNFISMVSHELRNPLGIILSSSQILERYSERITPEKGSALFASIQQAVARITGLTEEVLLFGRFEAGRVELRVAQLNLPAFCTGLVDEVLSATSQRCPIELQIGQGFEQVWLDEKLVRHILSNVLQNAVKFSPDGTAVAFRLRREEGSAVFEVRDHGVGIPAADKSRLFTSFHRCRNVGHIPGTGLGLVIVKRCVDVHGGRIEIDSEEGKGTTVTVRLPVTPPEPPAVVAERKRTSARRAAKASGIIPPTPTPSSAAPTPPKS